MTAQRQCGEQAWRVNWLCLSVAAERTVMYHFSNRSGWLGFGKLLLSHILVVPKFHHAFSHSIHELVCSSHLKPYTNDRPQCAWLSKRNKSHSQ
mmetsp:Transcript_10610/g.33900  ORF Transcript_10610/g.33900 Transcript_10610/m.33900 type:complete len:94 (+) Transcript_10610:1304-1585(+)